MRERLLTIREYPYLRLRQHGPNLALLGLGGDEAPAGERVNGNEAGAARG